MAGTTNYVIRRLATPVNAPSCGVHTLERDYQDVVTAPASEGRPRFPGNALTVAGQPDARAVDPLHQFQRDVFSAPFLGLTKRSAGQLTARRCPRDGSCLHAVRQSFMRIRVQQNTWVK